MNKNWLFKCDDYREAIQIQISREGVGRGYRTLMARAAGCQPAYLSQVLARSVHLTPEHASGLCDFWGLSELESEYFLTLVNLARSGNKRLSERLVRRLAQLKSEYEEQKPTSLKIEQHQYQKERAIFYYLNWAPSAVHLLLMIPGYDTPAAIGRRLKLDEAVVLTALRTLEELGIATRADSRWILTARTLHADDESLFAPHHHRNWREKASDYFRYGKMSANFHYTSVYSLDQKTFQEIRELFSNMVASSKRLVIPSPEETIACMNLDWFEI